ncbi:MAG: shikimate dehydrogenase [Planctomycetota bacterium]
MAKLVTSVSAARLTEVRTGIDQAGAAGAEWIELRLDHLAPCPAPSEVQELLSSLRPGSWIVTLRSVDEGGKCPLPAGRRLAFLLEATAGCEGWIDFEYRAFQAGACEGSEVARPSDTLPCETAHPVQIATSPRPPATDSGMPLPSVAAAAGRRWILSVHDFQGRPEDVRVLARAIVSTGPATMAKVAWEGHSARDNIVAFELMRELGERVIAVVMGEVGLASRVLAKKFGAAATYCALSSGTETAAGQLTLDEMLHRYRWDAISATTKWFGVLGAPVRHSMGPVLFNRLFDRAGLDAVYLPMLVAGGERELVTFLEHCERCDWLDLGGFSVTLPHKQAARRFVGPRVEPSAARIGAVNTLVMRDGRFHGCNTDCAGALDALCDGLDCERSDLRGLCVDVLGAGGAARAVVAGLTDCGCDVTVYNRTADSAAALAAEFGCRPAAWPDRTRRSGRVVINCTSLGMTPHVEQSPLPAEALQDRPVVFDMVYHPVETRLLREAKQAGGLTIDGLEMFVRQAAAQYQLWFGETPDARVMREIVLRDLGGDGLGHRGAEA